MIRKLSILVVAANIAFVSAAQAQAGGGKKGGTSGSGTAPAPINLIATGSPTTAVLTWTAPSGAVNYTVNRALAATTNWTAVTPTPIAATTFSDVVPDPTQTYTYAVQAYQKSGKYGEATVNFKAPPPTNPTGLVGSSSGQTVTLSWQAVQYASGYLITGPGIAGTMRIAATRYSFTAPAGTNVYRVGAVFDPGALQTPSSLWPSATVTVAQPILSCACTTTGAFTYPTWWASFLGSRSSGQQTFTHPTLGLLTLNIVDLNPPYADRLMLDVIDSRGQNLLSEGQVYFYAVSPNFAYFMVGFVRNGAQMPTNIYRIQPGPGKWPQILSTSAWWGNSFGFASNDMFVTARYDNTYKQYSFQAFNLLAANPALAVLDVQETNVTPINSPQPLLSSPCGDRLMYMRFGSAMPMGQANLYHRSSFGTNPPPTVIGDGDNTLSELPGAYAIPGSGTNVFLVSFEAYRERGTGSKTVSSLQCTP